MASLPDRSSDLPPNKRSVLRFSWVLAVIVGSTGGALAVQTGGWRKGFS